MRALSLWQPWGTLIALGEKTIETRRWQTPHRGLLAIHAAKTGKRWQRDLTDDLEFAAALRPHGYRTFGDLPTGAIVAVVNLVGCRPTYVDGRPSRLSPPVTTPEYAFGDFSEGRWMWKLDLVLRLPEPAPCVGRQGLFDWEPPDDVLALLAERGAA